MPKLHARLLGRPIPLLVLATAVVVGTFSGVGYAATRGATQAANASRVESTGKATTTSTTSASPTPAPLVWHQLTLLNGWVSAADWGTGTPSYAVSAEGVVYFAGSLRNGNPNDPAFIMPVGTRPGYYDCFSIYSNTSTVQEVGALHIYDTGKAYVQGPSARFFASLTGVSYVVGH
ncbi:MAG: hypothetical protein ACLP36_16130 [Acidimicrobiales bacterium]|jgi:hypothetical protein